MRESVALNVIATYLQAMTNKTTRDSLTSQRKLAEELYGFTRDRVNHGVAAELDAIRAMQQVNTLLQQSQEAEQDYVATKLTLANILQARITSEFDVADEAAYGAQDAPEREATIKTALMQRADYLAAEANVKTAELQLQSIKASRLPTIRMTFDDGQMGNSPVNNINTYKIQGLIDFPVFTGGRIHGEIVEAEGAIREPRSRSTRIGRKSRRTC
jgi:outer membrane protein TolC